MRVPDDLSRAVPGWVGAAGEAWVAALAAEWELTVGEPYQPSGHASLAVRVTRAGEPCVLKLRYPDEWSRHEGAALRHYGGGAAVALVQAVSGAAWSYDVGDVAAGDEFAQAARLIAALPG